MGSGIKTPQPKKEPLSAVEVEILKPQAEELIKTGNWQPIPGRPYVGLVVEKADLAEVIKRRLASLVGGQVPVIEGTRISVRENVLKSAQENLNRQPKKK